MSVVYEAVHDMLKTRHAVKVLDVPSESEYGKTLAAKFLAEARILATLRHPGIVRVTDFGTLPDGRSYFVMDRIEGSPRLLHEIDAAFPEWSPLLRKMLARDANERFASASDLPDSAPDRGTDIGTATNTSPAPTDTSTRGHDFRRTIRNWFIGSVATSSLLTVVNYIWKCFYLFSRHGGFPDGLPSFF